MSFSTARALILIGSVLTGLYPLSPASAQLPADSQRRIDSLFARLVRPDGPGYAIGIVLDGRLVYGKGFGLADVTTAEPITSATLFNAASLAKQFTGASVALLIARGAVSLDDPVRKYLPAFPERFGSVRVKHLVYMTSGLPEYYTLPRPGGRSWTEPFTNADAIAAVLAQPSLEFVPGSRWAYSNINYMLLAAIVEQVSGRAFGDFTREELFLPLGMAGTFFDTRLQHADMVGGIARGYNRDGDGYRTEPRVAPHHGGSGLFTSVADMTRWMAWLDTARVNRPAWTGIMLDTLRFDHDKTNDAFGLVWGRYGGERTLWYEGGDAGFSSYMVQVPERHLGVIVLSNLGEGRSAARGREVLAILLPATPP